MQARSKRLIAIAVALAASLAIYLIAVAPQPSDRDQIQSQIDTVVAAADRRSTNGIMAEVSGDFRSASLANTDQLHLLLAQAMRNAHGVDVVAPPSMITVTGDTAQSVGKVTIHTEDATVPVFDSVVTVHWKREDGRRLLVFPAKVWRIVSADYPDAQSVDQ